MNDLEVRNEFGFDPKSRSFRRTSPPKPNLINSKVKNLESEMDVVKKRLHSIERNLERAIELLCKEGESHV